MNRNKDLRKTEWKPGDIIDITFKDGRWYRGTFVTHARPPLRLSEVEIVEVQQGSLTVRDPETSNWYELRPEIIIKVVPVHTAFTGVG